MTIAKGEALILATIENDIVLETLAKIVLILAMIGNDTVLLTMTTAKGRA